MSGVEVQNIYANYHMAGDVISFITCVIFLIIISQVLYFSKDRKFVLLRRALWFIIVGTNANVSFYYSTKAHYNDIIIFGLRDIYHFCFMCTLYLFLVYMKTMLGVEGKLVSRIYWFTNCLFLFCLVGDVMSPFTHFGFYKDSQGLWHTSAMSLYNIFYAYAIILLGALVVFCYNRLIKAVRNTLIITYIICEIIIIYCAVKNINTYTSFTYVITIVVVMVLLHSRPYNDSTGALSGDTFDSYIAEADRKNIQLDYMVLRIKVHTGQDIPQELGKVLNYFWHASFKDATLFNPESNLYVLTVPRNEKNGNTEDKIKHLIVDEFDKYYKQFQLQYKVIGLFDIDFIHSSEDLNNILGHIMTGMDDNTFVLSDEKLIEELRMLSAIKNNLDDIVMKRDLGDPRVLAYVQPIMNKSTGKFDTAEALMRLSIPEKDFVPPYMFIPLAEFYGYIHELSRIMLNKVCQEISKLDQEGYQFNRISVNFVASEIIKEDFCDEILEIIRNNGVDPSRIGFELTESQNESDFEIIKSRIAELKEQGMTFYLDDIGTGYSNLDRIVKYDVDVVKFDRFFLLEAEKDPKVVKMMSHLAQAFKDLNYTLLYEGVETEENEELCVTCGAQYIQGFKYSKPIPIKDIRNFLEK